MINPKIISRNPLVIIDLTPVNGAIEARFDLEVIPVDLVTRMILVRLSGVWQAQNSKLRVERLEKEAM